MNNKELVEYLNSLEIIQKGSWDEDIPEEIWEKYFENKYETVDSELDIDKHRWYETSTEVIKINDGFIGIRSVTQCYSENSSIEDMYWSLMFFEMKEIKIVSYKTI
jgi:hypothetical protein